MMDIEEIQKRLAEIELTRMRSRPHIDGADVLPASSELSEELVGYCAWLLAKLDAALATIERVKTVKPFTPTGKGSKWVHIELLHEALMEKE